MSQVIAGPDMSKPAKSRTTFQTISTTRQVKNTLATVLFGLCFLIALVPLIAVLVSVVGKGLPSILSLDWWTGSLFLVRPDSTAGGVGHAIYGSLVQTLIATAVSVPIGIMAGIMLVEYPDSFIAKPTTFMVDILAGVPSIVAALFVFTVWVTTFGFEQSGFAVGLALVLMMIPLIVRSTEEMLKLVPDELRESAYALGVPKWKTIVFIVVPTALSGMLSGVFLAVARVMGETAPVLVLVGYTHSFNYDLTDGNMASLPLLIYNQLSNPTDAGQYRIWGAALTLIILIAVANVLAAVAAKILAPKGR